MGKGSYFRFKKVLALEMAANMRLSDDLKNLID